jgi:shikimate 5-dehydrogenase
MLKWAEISIKKNDQRFKCLSELLSTNGCANSIDYIESSPEDLEKTLNDAMKVYSSIRIGHGLGEVVTKIITHHSHMVGQMNSADALMKHQNKWWLRNYGVEAFIDIIKRRGEKFDFQSDALIVGSGAAAKVALTGLFISGFKKFTVSGLDEVHVEKFIKEMQRSHFGAEFKKVLKEELILLPGVHGIVVNTTPLRDDNPILAELYYFNFFKAGGLAIDFTMVPVETPLMKGATDIGADCIYGYEIAALTDIKWAEEILGHPLVAGPYAEQLKAQFSAQNLSV